MAICSMCCRCLCCRYCRSWLVVAVVVCCVVIVCCIVVCCWRQCNFSSHFFFTSFCLIMLQGMLFNLLLSLLFVCICRHIQQRLLCSYFFRLFFQPAHQPSLIIADTMALLPQSLKTSKNDQGPKLVVMARESMRWFAPMVGPCDHPTIQSSRCERSTIWETAGWQCQDGEGPIVPLPLLPLLNAHDSFLIDACCWKIASLRFAGCDNPTFAIFFVLAHVFVFSHCLAVASKQSWIS